MIANLPPEIILNIFSHLQIPYIHNAQLVSRRWNNFINLNQSSIYRQAAFVHRFAPEGATSLQKVRETYPGKWLKGVNSWKDLCKRWYHLERSWEGREPHVPIARMFPSTGRDVHRFKLDEEHRLVITTHRRGGLRVCCMDSGELLFEMAREYVRRFAHCEYSNGYLIFDRMVPNGLEVWRLKTSSWGGSIDSTPSTRSLPDDRQIDALKLFTRCTPSNTTCRGQFLPYAFLLPPHQPRAYRFVYPTLLIGSVEGEELYLYDIPSASLIQTIPLPRNESTLWTDDDGRVGIRINYVEICARYCFICTMSSVVIISRDCTRDGTPAMVVDFPHVDLEIRHPRIVQTYASRLRFRHDTNSRHLHAFHLDQPAQARATTALIPLNDQPQEFIGVHTSQDGKDFAAVSLYGNMYIVPDFERAIRGEKTWSEISQCINLEAPAVNLAFEYGRVCVQTTKGIYIFTLSTAHHAVLIRSPLDVFPRPRILPDISVNQLVFAKNRLSLQLVSCLKMTKTAVWLDWSEKALDDTSVGRMVMETDRDVLGAGFMDMERYGERTVCCVNFAPKEDGDENDASEDAERKERSPKSPVDRNVLVNVPVSQY